MLMLFVVVQIISIALVTTILILHFVNRPAICDSCKYLVKKGGGMWKYTCNSPCKEYSLSMDKFNKAPKICSSYCSRNTEEICHNNKNPCSEHDKLLWECIKKGKPISKQMLFQNPKDDPGLAL